MTEDKILLTAQYVEGDLTDTEKVEFENLLTTDATLQQYLLDYYDIHNSLQMELADDEGRAKLRETLNTLNREHFAIPEESSKVVKLNTYVKWFTAVAAILVVGLLIWAPWNGNLYQQFNESSQMMVTERGADQTKLDQAAALFNDQKYAEAKTILATLHTADVKNSLVSYYYAISLLETNEIAKARTMLEVLFNGESVYKYDAAYTMAMSYLKEDKKVDAKFWLQKIPADATQYNKAQKVLSKL